MNAATTAEIAAVLGHKTLVMEKRYSHLSDEHVRGVVESTARKVFGDASFLRDTANRRLIIVGQSPE